MCCSSLFHLFSLFVCTFATKTLPPSPLSPYPITQPCATAPLKGSPVCDTSLSLDARLDSLIEQLQASSISQFQRANLLAHKSLPIEALNLGFYDWWNEALHGVAGAESLAVAGLGACFKTKAGQKRCATSFPAAITSSCSFNKTLFEAMGTAIGIEGRVFNNLVHAGLTYWTPNVNIFRDPRWGRGQETPGEDPLLNSDYASSFVRGFQNGPEDPNHLKAAACCKHFVAYSLEDSDMKTRHNFNALVSEQDLTDTYMPAFLACATSGKAAGVMCSYNAVNGVPMCANKPLLEGLRNAGFDGYITGDCGAVRDVAEFHKYSPVDETCGVVLGAGMDLDCGAFFEFHLEQAMNNGSVSAGLWSRAARNLFKVQMRLGMFDPDSAQPFRKFDEDLVDSAEHRALALEAAKQGMVLVKNINHTLPLSSVASLAVLGPNGNATVQMQSNYHGEAPLLISPLQALKGYVNLTRYSKGCSIFGSDESEIASAVAVASWASRVVLVLGLDQSMEGEARDRFSIGLPGVQSKLLQAVAAAAQHPITLVLISGGPVDILAAKENPKVGAILIAGYPGQAGGQAIADTLFGLNNPSGRLTQTWYPTNFTAMCKMSDMNMRPNTTTGCPGRTYRFYQGPVVFRFGDGLSFTEFTYELLSPPVTQLQAEEGGGKGAVAVRVNVTNVGTRAGAHVVLGMVEPPQAGVDGSPLFSLRQYHRLWLAPGQSEPVTLSFEAADFSLSDSRGRMELVSGEWVIRLTSQQQHEAGGEAGVAVVVHV